MIEKYAFKFLSKHQIRMLKEPIPEEYNELGLHFSKYLSDQESTTCQMEHLKKFNAGVKEYLEELLEITPAQQQHHQTKGNTLLFHRFKY